MKPFLKLFFTLIMLLPNATFAAKTSATPKFVEGKDYKLVTPNMATVTNIIPAGKVQVIEFFSYGCPWCYRLEPYLEKWLAHKPANVDFRRVPVVFESGWDTYAKAYYTAKALDVETK
jgi:thiol:disulfide interchange protein DsbA